MDCPSSSQIDEALAKSGASANIEECYTQWVTNPSAYAAQYDGASLHVQIAQQNPASLTTPQPGTVPVDLSKSGLIAQILGVLGKGATAYQKYQLETTLAEAQANKKPVYLPPNLSTGQPSGVAQSQVPWSAIGIGGAILIGGIILVALAARRN